PDAVYSVIEQLAGAAVPAAALESLILPTRVPGYAPPMLDELTAAGDVVWAGAGALPGGDGWLVLAPADSAPLLVPPPGEITMTPVHEAVLSVLSGGGALFFRALADRVVNQLTDRKHRPGNAPGGDGSDGHDAARRVRALNRVTDQAIAAAIWDLVWAGLVTNDTLAPLRTLLSAGKSWVPGPGPAANGGPTRGDNGHASAGGWQPGGRPGFGTRGPSSGRPNRRPSFGRGSLPSHSGPPTVSGRWSLLPPVDPDLTRRLHARAL